jgi:hypothetical protein
LRKQRRALHKGRAVNRVDAVEQGNGVGRLGADDVLNGLVHGAPFVERQRVAETIVDERTDLVGDQRLAQLARVELDRRLVRHGHYSQIHLHHLADLLVERHFRQQRLEVEAVGGRGWLGCLLRLGPELRCERQAEETGENKSFHGESVVVGRVSKLRDDCARWPRLRQATSSRRYPSGSAAQSHTLRSVAPGCECLHQREWPWWNVMPRRLHFGTDQWIAFWRRQCPRRHPDQNWAWQRGSFHRRMRDRGEYEEKLAYVRENPLRMNLVKTPEEWPSQGIMPDLRWTVD